MPRRPWAGVCSRPLHPPYSHSLSDDDTPYRSACRARGRRHARSAAKDADAPASRGHPECGGNQRAGARARREAAEAAERALRAPVPEVSNVSTARLLRRSGSDVGRSRLEAGSWPRRGWQRRRQRTAPWPTSSTPACTTRCAAIRASSSTAKTWPTAAATSSAGKAGQRQRRRLQADRRPANRIRLRARLQFAAGRSEYRGPRHRLCDPRHEAGRRDSVLRLHLAGHAPDSQ